MSRRIHMRTSLAFFSLLLIPFSVRAQIDPATQAAQQAAIANQQAMEAANQAALANQQAMQAAQQASQQSQNAPIDPATPCCVAWTMPPKFSVKPGKYSGPVTVKITDASRGAIIYYSTDGWTPTVNSPRYRGPIPIDSTMTVQAIAIAPYSMRSVVSSAQYTIAGASAPATAYGALPPAPASANGKMIPVPLIFAADVSSKTASVGDKVPMELAQDLKVGDYVVKQGTPATVTITQVDKTGIGGAPGSLSFEAEDLHPASGPIPLVGGATRDGEAKLPNASALIPVVGQFTVFRHGEDAIITKGTTFVAYLEVDGPPPLTTE